MKALIIVYILLFGTNTMAQKIKIKGAWQVSSSTASFVAGDDVSENLTSNADQLEISVSGNLNKTSWAVNVSKSDIVWNNNLEIWVKRTGNGSGSGQCFGGTVYQKVNNASFKFFDGQRVQNSIPVQLEIRGITVTIPATAYSTNLIFTLYEY